MGGADEPPLLDRIHSWAKASASDRNPFQRQDSARSLDLPKKTSKSQNTTHHGATSQPGLSRSTSNSDQIVDVVKGEKSKNTSSDAFSPSDAKSATPLGDDKEARNESSALGVKEGKPPWSIRIKEGSKRFVRHTRNAIFHSWINVLLIFVPIGIAINWVPMPEKIHPTVVFSLNAVAVVPLAGLLAHATESVASRMGDTWASLLNVTFGNAVELIIFIIALAKNQIRIVQASILGSILANLLLILGMAFTLGGLRFREQIYNSTVTQMSACLLSLSVTSLLLPTAFHASFSDYAFADEQTTKISRGVSVVLLLVYAMYLAFQLKSHAYMYESTPQNVIDEESHPGVLADLMNSSSDSSSSSSDSDSDSSTGSSHTTVKKIRRALRHTRRRRKSSGSSFETASTSASPTDNRANSSNTNAQPPAAEIVAKIRREQRGSNTAVLSGDEADTDGEHGIIHGTSRFRDFGDTGESSMSIHNINEMDEGELSREQRKKARKAAKREAKRAKHERKKAKKNRKRLEAEHRQSMLEQSQEAEMPTLETVEPMTERTPQQMEEGLPPLPASQQPKRPFAMTRASFRPAMPKVLSNTVFSTPPPPPQNSTQPARLAVAYRGGPYRNGLRRTNSLPDRFNDQREQGQPARATGQAGESAQRGGTLAINEADVIRKDMKEDDEPEEMSRTAAVVLLLVTTGLVAFCAELLVDAIPEMVADSNVSQAFIGLIILPIVGNAAEHVTAVTVATKNKMDLAIGVAVGSSIQIALFVTPFVVILGWIMGKEMSLYFNLFETVSLFVTAFVINFLILDGRSNYLEGTLLMAAYVIIAVCAFFYPDGAAQSDIGGGAGTGG